MTILFTFVIKQSRFERTCPVNSIHTTFWPETGRCALSGLKLAQRYLDTKDTKNSLCQLHLNAGKLQTYYHVSNGQRERERERETDREREREREREMAISSMRSQSRKRTLFTLSTTFSLPKRYIRAPLIQRETARDCTSEHAFLTLWYRHHMKSRQGHWVLPKQMLYHMHASV
jgi:hypothetical protein